MHECLFVCFLSICAKHLFPIDVRLANAAKQRLQLQREPLSAVVDYCSLAFIVLFLLRCEKAALLAVLLKFLQVRHIMTTGWKTISAQSGRALKVRLLPPL